MPSPTVFRQIILSKKRSVALEAETEAFFARTSGSYSDADKLALNTFIKSLKDGGIWSTIDFIHLYAFGDTQNDSLLNIKSSSFNGSIVNNPTWVRRQGFTSSSTGTRYVNTNFTPSTAGGNLTQNSAYLANYCRTSRAAAANIDIGTLATHRSFIRNFTTGSLLEVTLNHNSISTRTASVANSQQFNATARNNNTTLSAYKNSSDLGSGSVSSTGLPTSPIFVGCLNNSGTPAQFTNSEYAAAIAGGYLSFSQHDALYSALLTLLTYLGANV